MKHRLLVLVAAAATPPIALAGVKSGLMSATPSLPLWYLLLAAPFWEEMLFRGVLHRRLLGFGWGVRSQVGLSAANWLASCCFVLAHLPFQGWRAVAVLLPSLILGLQFEGTGRLFPCILLHAWFNLSWMLAARFCGGW